MKFPRHKITAAIAGVVALSTALTGCTGGGGEASGGTEAPNEISIASFTDLSSYDPGKLTGGQQLYYWQPVYETLIRRDSDGTLIANVAEKWGFTDPLTFTLTIREGLKYADGSAITADSIVKGIDRFRKGTGPDAAYLKSVVDVAAEGQIVTLQLSEPDPGLPDKFSASAGAVANPAAFDSPNVDSLPGASGPYVLDEEGTTPGSQYHFVRNENYWDPEAYAYDEVTVVLLEDLTARSNALKSGQVDVAVLDGASAADIKAAGKVITEHSAAWEGYWFWDKQGKVDPALSDVRVRRAMNMAIDRENIVDKLMLGFGTPTQQIWRDTSPAFVSGADDYAFDVDGAKKLMAEAGYADGFDIDIPAPSGAAYLQPTIEAQLGAIGVRVNWLPVSLEQYLPNIVRGDYAMGFWRFTHDSPWVDITRWVAPNGQMNPFKNDNPEIAALIDTARTATTPEAASDAYAKIGDYVYREAWFMPINFNVQVVAHSPEINVTGQVGQSVIPIRNYSPAT